LIPSSSPAAHGRGAEAHEAEDILAQLQYIYAGTVGAEFAHMSDSEERLWLQDEFQEGRLKHRFSTEEQRNILWQLTAAEARGATCTPSTSARSAFSLEGADAFIPLLDDLIQNCGAAGIEEVVIGMAHRGRLNVLVNLLASRPRRCSRNSRVRTTRVG